MSIKQRLARLEHSIPELPDICDVPPQIVLPVIDQADEPDVRRKQAFIGWSVLVASTGGDVKTQRDAHALGRSFLNQLPAKITHEARRRYARYLSGEFVELDTDEFGNELNQARELFLEMLDAELARRGIDETEASIQRGLDK